MLLAIDIGNTTINLGIFNKDKLLYKIFCSSQKQLFSDFIEILNSISIKYNIKECIISSVVDEITEEVKNSVLKIFKIHSKIVSIDCNLNINFKQNNPKIGIDRIVNSIGALSLYQAPVIIIDSGSATTFDIVDKNKTFIGGLIMPGIDIQLKSLYNETSKLPNIKLNEFKKNNHTINIDTKQAILSGVIKGHAHAIEGLIEDCKKELDGHSTVVLTGGCSKLLSNIINKNFYDYVNPDLTLYGLYIANKY